MKLNSLPILPEAEWGHPFAMEFKGDQARLAYGAVAIWEAVKDEPGVVFKDGTDLNTAMLLEQAGLLKKERSWNTIEREYQDRWYIKS